MKQQEMWKDVVAAVTVEKEVRARTPCVGGNGRTGWDLRVDKFEEIIAVASEAHGPAMMWARPTCTSLACYAGSFLLASMFSGVEPLQHLALAHAIVFPLHLRAGAVCKLLCAKPGTTLSRETLGYGSF